MKICITSLKKIKLNSKNYLLYFHYYKTIFTFLRRNNRHVCFCWQELSVRHWSDNPQLRRKSATIHRWKLGAVPREDVEALSEVEIHLISRQTGYYEFHPRVLWPMDTTRGSKLDCHGYQKCASPFSSHCARFPCSYWRWFVEAGTEYLAHPRPVFLPELWLCLFSFLSSKR